MAALQPFFTLSPSSPQDNTYNAANATAPYGLGQLYCFGIYTGYTTPKRFSDQYAANEVILGYDPVALTDQAISDVPNDVYRRPSLRIDFRGYNVNTGNQYLLLLALRRVQGTPTAQIFVNTSLVDTEELSGDEQMAVLLDCPGDGIATTVYVRLASHYYWSQMAFKGVDCYLL